VPNKDKVVGIDTRLTSETLLGVAHLPNKQIGIICGVQATAHMLEHILHGYYPHLALEAVTLEEAPSVLALAQRSDHIIATHTCAREVEALIGRPVDVVVNFQVDEQSLSYLEQRIQKIRAGKLAEVPAVHDVPRGERAGRGAK
jgi:GntR family transcriptional regulator